ncbi:hypothetical protein B2J88_42120 [Rhodococcus sp. SRB_17]|nr:hypothetical protein [Rhodococcus sp. SRB_17]
MIRFAPFEVGFVMHQVYACSSVGIYRLRQKSPLGGGLPCTASRSGFHSSEVGPKLRIIPVRCV